MPGMAANPAIFEKIRLPEPFELHLLDWEMPLKDESLCDYAKRIVQKIKTPKPILLGVSFGAIIVQEIAKLIDYECIIVISSIKSDKELPPRMRLARRTNLHKILPTQWVSNSKFWEFASFVGAIKYRKKLYEKYMTMSDAQYLDWAIDKLVHWRQQEPLPRTLHIHGDNDWIFPIQYIENPIVIHKGTHIMIINRYRWFNENLPKLLIEKT